MSIFLACLLTGAILSSLFLFFFYFILKNRIKNIGSLINSNFTIASESNTVVYEAFDDFVRNRLGNELPVVNMFLDERFIAEINEVFKKEVDNQLPSIINSFISQVNTETIQKLIIFKIRVHLILIWVCGIGIGGLFGWLFSM